mgnify:CR=1 FL=1
MHSDHVRAACRYLVSVVGVGGPPPGRADPSIVSESPPLSWSLRWKQSSRSREGMEAGTTGA